MTFTGSPLNVGNDGAISDWICYGRGRNRLFSNQKQHVPIRFTLKIISQSFILLKGKTESKLLYF